jgi:hypothetical protein
VKTAIIVLSWCVIVLLSIMVQREKHFKEVMATRPATITISTRGDVSLTASGDCTLHSLVFEESFDGTFSATTHHGSVINSIQHDTVQNEKSIKQ